MSIRCRCPNPRCRASLELDDSLLGKNTPCPSCGQIITVVPLVVAEGAQQERDSIVRADEVRRTIPVRGLLENVRSLWNVGSIFRTSDGAGVEMLYLCGITGCPPRKEITKTALGAEEAVPWTYRAEAAEAVEHARTEGCSIVCLEKTDSSVDVREAEYRFPVCLAVGSETSGLSAALLETADMVVHIPMSGVKRSLNVAVAYGIAAFEIARRANAVG